MLFFVTIILQILSIFVRYKIIASATEGLVQHTLQAIWVLGLI
jgi:hypothetical protein